MKKTLSADFFCKIWFQKPNSGQTKLETSSKSVADSYQSTSSCLCCGWGLFLVPVASSNLHHLACHKSIYFSVVFYLS